VSLRSITPHVAITVENNCTVPTLIHTPRRAVHQNKVGRQVDAATAGVAADLRIRIDRTRTIRLGRRRPVRAHGPAWCQIDGPTVTDFKYRAMKSPAGRYHHDRNYRGILVVARSKCDRLGRRQGGTRLSKSGLASCASPTKNPTTIFVCTKLSGGIIGLFIRAKPQLLSRRPGQWVYLREASPARTGKSRVEPWSGEHHQKNTRSPEDCLPQSGYATPGIRALIARTI
jgi:hypothetical protein